MEINFRNLSISLDFVVGRILEYRSKDFKMLIDTLVSRFMSAFKLISNVT